MLARAGEGVIAAYYQIRGWPMMLASSERGAFLKKIHAIKVAALPRTEQQRWLGCLAAVRAWGSWPPSCSMQPGCLESPAASSTGCRSFGGHRAVARLALHAARCRCLAAHTGVARSAYLLPAL